VDGAVERTDTTKKAASFETYSSYQEDTKKAIERFATRTEDETWSKNNGYTRDSVRAARATVQE
jgi:hypothetical protein